MVAPPLLVAMFLQGPRAHCSDVFPPSGLRGWRDHGCKYCTPRLETGVTFVQSLFYAMRCTINCLVPLLLVLGELQCVFQTVLFLAGWRLVLRRHRGRGTEVSTLARTEIAKYIHLCTTVTITVMATACDAEYTCVLLCFIFVRSMFQPSVPARLTTPSSV